MDDAELLKKVVAETVAETLMKLGMNTGDPIALQKDMQHLRSWRESTETIKRQGLMTAMAIIVSGTLALIWIAVSGR
jgi:hypothetical protein